MWKPFAAKGLTLLIPAYHAGGGIAAYAAVQDATLWFVGRRSRLHVTFAAMSVCAAAFLFTSAGYFRAESVSAAATMLRWQSASGLFFFPALFLFVAIYTEQKVIKPWFLLVLVFFASLVVVAFTHRYGARFTTLHLARPLILPWGETLSRFVGTLSPWNIVARLGMTALLVWAAVRATVLYRRTERRAALVLAGIFVLFLLASAEGLFVDLNYVPFIYISGFVFLALVLFMSAALAIDLRDTDERFRQLTRHIQELFFIYDVRQRRMLYVSPAYEAIWGRPRSGLYENPNDFFVPIDPGDRARTGAERLLVEAVNVEFRVRHQNAEPSWVQARSIPLRSASGDLLRIVGIATDITEQKHLQATRFMLTAQQRDELVWEVHHRIRNALQGAASLLRLDASRDAQIRVPLEHAVLHLEALAIVHGLQVQGRTACIKLDDVLNAIIAAVEVECGAHIDCMHRSAPQWGVTVSEAESVPVALILNELLMNAATHQPDGPVRTVGVTVDADQSQVCIGIENLAPAGPMTFDFSAAKGLGSGLRLVKSLLPSRGSHLTITTTGSHVQAKLYFSPPVLQREQ